MTRMILMTTLATGFALTAGPTVAQDANLGTSGREQDNAHVNMLRTADASDGVFSRTTAYGVSSDIRSVLNDAERSSGLPSTADEAPSATATESELDATTVQLGEMLDAGASRPAPRIGISPIASNSEHDASWVDPRVRR